MIVNAPEGRDTGEDRVGLGAIRIIRNHGHHGAQYLRPAISWKRVVPKTWVGTFNRLLAMIAVSSYQSSECCEQRQRIHHGRMTSDFGREQWTTQTLIRY